jgi:tetratricopeptide (TPR) repeat protein
VPRRHQLAACAAFFVSGAAGLVYQVVWSRLFNEVFGVSAYFVAAVLATYLALAVRGDLRGADLLAGAAAAAPADAGALRQLAGEAAVELGRRLDLQGRLPEAAALYAEGIGIWPGAVEGHVNLARIAGIQGRREEAVLHLSRALAENPLSGTAHAMLGRLYAEAGEPDRAIPHLREAVRIAPLTADLHEDLGLSLAVAQDPGDALREFEEALRLAPDWPAAVERVALMLATSPDPRERRPDEAIRLAERAVALAGHDDPMALEVEAAAYAAGSRFEDAVRAELEVLELARARHEDALAAAARATLDLYARHVPLPPIGAPRPRRRTGVRRGPQRSTRRGSEPERAAQAFIPVSGRP